MRPTGTREKSRRTGIRKAVANLCFGTCTSLLVVLLALQAILLLRGAWEVPDLLVAKLHQELDARGWQAEYASLGFSFPASVTVTQLRLGRTGEVEALAEADYGRIDFSLGQLLQGKPQIEAARLFGGTAFCPAAQSPTGLREEVLEQVYVSLRQRDGVWEIEHLSGKAHNFSVTASGSGLVPSLPAPDEEAEPLDWDSLLANVLPRILREQPNFQRARNPHLHLRVLPLADQGLSVAIEGWADSIDAPWDVRVTRPHIASTWRFDGTGWQGESATFEADAVSWAPKLDVDWDPEITARTVSAKLVWAPGPGTDGEQFLPDHGTFSATELQTSAGSITGFHADLRRTGAARTEAAFYALVQEGPLAGTGHFDWSTGDGRLDLTSRMNPTPFLQHEITRELGLRRDISFGETPFARATAWMKNWDIVRASGHAHARQANIDGVFMDQASAHAELLPGRFVVPEMVLSYGDFQALGFYEVDMEDRSYRLLFKGDTLPLHIQAWFRPWWVSLWKEFAFPAEPLNGDLDIRGRHGHSDEVKLFGAVQARNFSLREVPFDSLDGKLVVLDGYVDLFHIDLRRTEGSAEGWFRYRPDPATRGFGQLDFEAHSSVDPVEVAQVFGDSGGKALSGFSFTKPPALLLKGTVHRAERKSESRVTITGRTDSPLAYHGLALDHLMIDAILQGSDWNFRQIDAGLAGGKVTGDARKWQENEEEKLDFSLIMNDLDTSRALEVISNWRGEPGPEELEDPVDPVDPAAKASLNVGGLVDMTILATGNFADFQSFQGTGSFEVREAQLGEIHLLGLLSRLLASTPLGFTSLQFTEAEARFLIDLQKIDFTDIRLTGPTSEIRASGNYLMQDDALDFLVKLNYLSESRIPFLSLLLTPVLEPLAQVMRIHLTGSSSEPEWKFLLGPRNILKGISEAELNASPPKAETGGGR